MLKSMYVAVMRAASSLARRFGMTERLATSTHPIPRHLLSLLAIYDLDQMVTLDRPWWTYRSADEVQAFLLGRRKARVFEFGAGASTIWLAKRAAEVVSVEHDLEFADNLAAHLDRWPSVTLHAVAPSPRTDTSTATSQRAGYERSSFDEYVDTINRVGGLFDLIVIDGRAREACLANSIEHLAADGILVFDNSNRDRYRSAIEESGLHERLLHGWCPSLPTPSTTSLLTAIDE
jgi:hypothetical protein